MPSVLNLSRGFSQKYGTVFSQTLHQWWLQTGHQFLQREGSLRWISYIQLFCDFLLATKHPGVLLVGGRWGVEHDSIPQQNFPNFAQRSRWFQMSLKAFWKQGEVRVLTKLQRSASSALACWQSAALLAWDEWRLNQVDVAIHSQLGLVSRSIALEGLGVFPLNPGMMVHIEGV